MARKRDSGNPAFPVRGAYKFDPEVDRIASEGTEALFNIDTGKPIVMKRSFNKRRDAQIAERKRRGM